MPTPGRRGGPSRSRSRDASRAGSSQDEVRYPIPAASARAWEKHKNLSPQNPGLIFDRFVQDWGWREQEFRDKEAKKKAWLEVVGIAPRADKELLAAWNARWEQTARAVHAEPFTLKTDWRFLTGLGRKGPLEVGFTFHRYGFPILPGSSVKGVARAWATFELGGERDAEANDDFRAIFGRAPKSADEPGTSGRAIFFDAIPAGVPGLELDIMNPHYPDYYGSDKFPTDWQNPRPVCFLTVAHDTPFRFAVGWRGTPNVLLHEKAVKWLKEGLMNLGAGAKTSAGYGYFSGESATASPSPAPAPVELAAGPEEPMERKTSIGKVRYEGGKPYIVDQADSTIRLRVNWKALGLNDLAGGTVVDYTCEVYGDGRRKVVAVSQRSRG